MGLLFFCVKIWLKSILFAEIFAFIVLLMCTHQCIIKPRWHWFEIHDEWWCPNIGKKFYRRMLYEVVWNDGLSAGNDLAKALLPIINRNNISLILDLCSGSSGPSEIINKTINIKNKNKNGSGDSLITILTDLYPQVSSWKLFAKNNCNILYSSKPIDATNIDMNIINSIYNTSKSNGKILRTMFAAIHHFQPNLCIKMFEDTFRKKDMMILMDSVDTKGFMDFMLFYVVFSCLAPLATIKMIKFWLIDDKELNMLQKILHIVLVIVFFSVFLFEVIHDALISMARMYGEKEFKKMSQNGLKNINQNIQYEFNYIKLQSPIYLPFGLDRNGPCLFVCTPIS